VAEHSVPRPSSLEAELRILGRRLEVPQPPDLTAAVRARLEAPADGGRSPSLSSPWLSSPWLRPAAVAVALLIALGGTLAASPDVRAAVADLFRFAGIEIHRTEPPPSRGTVELPAQAPANVAEARRRAAFAVQVPAALGPPDQVTLSDGNPPRVVSLLYRAGPGRPAADQSGVAVRVDQFDGTLSPAFEKFARDFDEVTVAGRRALWIHGPHTVVYIDRNGVEYAEAGRLAGNTLVLQFGTVTVRLEGAFTLDQAVRIAGSLR
jgi:hypothetical protein